MYCFFFFNETATPEIYTRSLHDALPSCVQGRTHSWSGAQEDTGIHCTGQINLHVRFLSEQGMVNVFLISIQLVWPVYPGFVNVIINNYKTVSGEGSLWKEASGRTCSRYCKCYLGCDGSTVKLVTDCCFLLLAVMAKGQILSQHALVILKWSLSQLC